MRFGFADTLSGQLHFRACGAGPDIVLLPWAARQRPHVRTRDAAPGARRISRHRLRPRRHRPLPQEMPQLDRAAVRDRRARSLRLAAYRALHRGRWALRRLGRGGNVVSLAGAGHRRGARRRARVSRPRNCARCKRPTAGLSPKLGDDGAHRSFAFDVTRAHAQGVGSGASSSRRRRCRWSTNSCATTSSWATRPSPPASRRTRAAARAAHDVLARLGEVSQRVLVMTSDTDSLAPGLQPRARARAQFARPQVRGQSPGAHAGARRRVRAGARVVRAPLAIRAASRAAAAGR